jgi:hypothetical protein
MEGTPATMIHYLAEVAKEARERAERKQVHIAAQMSADQSRIYRFEQGDRWPRDVEKIVSAYADDLDIEPAVIWDEAVRRFRLATAGKPWSGEERRRQRDRRAAQTVERLAADARRAQEGADSERRPPSDATEK